MFRRISVCAAGIIGIALTVIQFIFGACSYVAAHFDSGMINGLRLNTDRITSAGVLYSLETFSVHAFFAGLLCSAISAVALSVFIKKGWETIPGLCFLIAGSLNSLILFGAGLPAGIFLVIAGIAVISGKSNRITPKPPIIQRKKMSD
ncbi:hypothetical protein NIE88_13615 [Sporolactobacillus shoreicorticis]|uniref:DUF4064 domain-containing protein n=1 Tax=Sporolactobacillus shoreicorticis TaxID=1923877 RepID=A0ABW5RZY1_9BACL|nr:hypothetical protein [Sporolactobacillus shoreicorticis]MCO7126804.1 hypothetical protein [Sporolactobacillus shoreicorticis]